MRAQDRRDRPPVAALGALAVGASLSAALGPILGGTLIALAGWPAIFLVNVPVTAVGLLLTRTWLPADPAERYGSGQASGGRWGGLRSIDIPGVVLFSIFVSSLLGFLLSLADRRLWPLFILAGPAAILLVRREMQVSAPFLDLRLLAANRALVGVYAQFAAVNLVFYSVFFGLPLWLEETRRLAPATVGLVLLPVAGVGVLATPLAGRLVARSGPRPALVAGASLLLGGSLLLLGFGASTPLAVLLLVGAVLGVPNGFNNLGLQAALYRAAPAAQIGAAGGLFQTFRYLGATLSTVTIGLVFGRGATSESLHILAVIIAAVSLCLLLASVWGRRGRRAAERA